MKRIEFITAFLIVLGIGMKLLLIPGGSVILGISLTVLACLYYPAGIFYFNNIHLTGIFKKKSYKELSFLRVTGAVAGGLIFSILCVGMLFKLLQLPGSRPMLIAGLCAGCLFLLIILIRFLINRGNTFYRDMVVRSLLILSLSGILYSVSGLTLVKIFYRNHPEYIQAYEKAANNPNDMDLQRQAEEIREKITD